jgi:prophage regulatory protein
MVDTFLRLEAVKRATGLGRSTIYDLIAEKRFPRPVKLNGGRAVAWPESEVAAWQQERIKERDRAGGGVMRAAADFTKGDVSNETPPRNGVPSCR